MPIRNGDEEGWELLICLVFLVDAYAAARCIRLATARVVQANQTLSMSTSGSLHSTPCIETGVKMSTVHSHCSKSAFCIVFFAGVIDSN
jgi:hypothetical protein